MSRKKNAEDDTFFQTNFNKTANIYLAQRFKTICEFHHIEDGG